MRFYCNSYTRDDGEHDGYGWFTAKADALRVARQFIDAEGVDSCAEVETTCVNIRPTKRGILAALRVHASHADNG